MSNSLKDKNLYFPTNSKNEGAKFISDYEMNITPGKKTNAKIMEVPLDLIKLDPDNVRFRHITAELKDVQLERLIWNLQAAKKLYNQIKWSQGLQEKPVLMKNEEKFIVKEGNMRIVCLRKLKQEIEFGDLKSNNYNIDPVRCIVLPKKTSEKEESIFLSRVHVKGKTQWGAFQKAAHIYDMIEENGFDYADVSEGVGVSKAKAKRMKRAFENMISYEDKYNDEKWREKYSYFYELEKERYSKTKKNPLPEGWVDENLEKFMEWIHNKQIEKGREVRKLPKIVNNKLAYDCLLNGGTIQEATERLAQYDPEVGDKVFSKLASIRKYIEEISESEEKKIEVASNSPRLNFLKELRRDLDKLINEIESVEKKNGLDRKARLLGAINKMGGKLSKDEFRQLAKKSGYDPSVLGGFFSWKKNGSKLQRIKKSGETYIKLTEEGINFLKEKGLIDR